MHDQTSTVPLTPEERQHAIRELVRLLREGYRKFRETETLQKPAVRDEVIDDQG